MFLMIDSGRDEPGLQGSGKWKLENILLDGLIVINTHTKKKSATSEDFIWDAFGSGEGGGRHEVVVLRATSVLYISARGMASGAGSVKTARPYYLQTLRWHAQPRVVPSRLWTAVPAGE